MGKHDVFISHSPLDSSWIVPLKESLLRVLGDRIRIFLSSDGSSLPLGSNWIYSLDQALNRARMMLVFLTPNSIPSRWVYFESGYGYSRGIPVVPIGVLGIKVEEVGPPLSNLQGFNLVDYKGLDNIVGVINEKLRIKKSGPFFNEEEYGNIFSSLPSETNIHDPMVQSIDKILIYRKCDREDLLDEVERLASQLKYKHFRTQNDVNLEGMAIDQHTVGTGKKNGKVETYIRIRIDPVLLKVTLMRGFQFALHFSGDKLPEPPIIMHVDFKRNIDMVSEHMHKTARLSESEVSMEDNGWLGFRNFKFSVVRDPVKRHGSTSFASSLMNYDISRMKITEISDTVDAQDLLDLLKLLFEKQVIFETTNSPISPYLMPSI